MKRLTQAGFSHVVVVALFVGVFALVGFAGYTVMNAQNDTNVTLSTSESNTSADQKAIESTPALKEADSTLSDVNAELNSQLDTAALDADIQNLY